MGQSQHKEGLLSSRVKEHLVFLEWCIGQPSKFAPFVIPLVDDYKATHRQDSLNLGADALAIIEERKKEMVTTETQPRFLPDPHQAPIVDINTNMDDLDVIILAAMQDYTDAVRRGDAVPICWTREGEFVHYVHKLMPHHYHQFKKEHFGHPNQAVLPDAIHAMVKRQLVTSWRMLGFGTVRKARKFLCQKYQMFLMLLKRNPGKMIVPTLGIDLIWHSHMADHEQYTSDCMKFFGFLLNHSDEIPEHGEKGLRRGREATRDMWKELFDRSTYRDERKIPVPRAVGRRAQCASELPLMVVDKKYQKEAETDFPQFFVDTDLTNREKKVEDYKFLFKAMYSALDTKYKIRVHRNRMIYDRIYAQPGGEGEQVEQSIQQEQQTHQAARSRRLKKMQRAGVVSTADQQQQQRANDGGAAFSAGSSPYAFGAAGFVYYSTFNTSDRAMCAANAGCAGMCCGDGGCAGTCGGVADGGCNAGCGGGACGASCGGGMMSAESGGDAGCGGDSGDGGGGCGGGCGGCGGGCG